MAPETALPPSNHSRTPAQSADLLYAVMRWTSGASPPGLPGNSVGATRAYVSPFASLDRYAGTFWVSICNALFGSDGWASRNRPLSVGFSRVGRDQKYGVKNATGPL